MDGQQASWWALANTPEVVELVGSDDEWPAWIFQEHLEVTVEQASVNNPTKLPVAVVVTAAGAWTSANEHNTLRFPRIRVDIYADPQRNGDGHMSYDDTRAKILAVWEQIDRVLHRVDPTEQMWDGTRVIRSQRLDGEPEFFQVPDGGGMQRAQVHYGLGVG